MCIFGDVLGHAFWTNVSSTRIGTWPSELCFVSEASQLTWYVGYVHSRTVSTMAVFLGFAAKQEYLIENIYFIIKQKLGFLTQFI